MSVKLNENDHRVPIRRDVYSRRILRDMVHSIV
jgi:hypothetical protein